MLAVKNLERLMEIEADLKSQWEAKLAVKDAEILKAQETRKQLEAKLEKQRASLAEQQQKIADLNSSNLDTSRVEQLNRELESRSARLQDEVASQKKRIKTLQRELAAEREELKSLKQFDAQKLKKNLDTNKKKLAEKISANDLLQKSNKKLKKENDELRQQIKELEAKAEQADDPSDTKGAETSKEGAADSAKKPAKSSVSKKAKQETKKETAAA